jgi:hypothetical protein
MIEEYLLKCEITICYVYRRLIESLGIFEDEMVFVSESQTTSLAENCGYHPPWAKFG